MLGKPAIILMYGSVKKHKKSSTVYKGKENDHTQYIIIILKIRYDRRESVGAFSRGNKSDSMGSVAWLYFMVVQRASHLISGNRNTAIECTGSLGQLST